MMENQRVGVRPSWVDDTLFPFDSQFVELDGHVVHYVDEGSGPVLLTAAPDYRYTPEEHSAATIAFVDRLGLSNITLVAQDWGGPIGIHAVQERPDAFQALVLGNTWAWPVNGDLHFEIFSHLMGGLLGRQLIRRFNLFVNVMIPAGHRRRKLPAAEMAHYRSALPTPARREPSAVFPRAITASRPFLADLERRIDSVAHLPALILWADADVAFREKELRRLEALLPHHTTIDLHGAGHFLQSDAPHEFAEAIRTWRPTQSLRRPRM